MALTAIQVKEAKSHGKDLKISDGEDCDYIELMHRVFSNKMGISQAEWDVLKTCLTVHRYPARHYLLKVGELAKSQYFVASGLVRLYYLGIDGKEYIKGFYCENIMVGNLSAMIMDEPSRFAIETLEPCVLIELESKEDYGPALQPFVDRLLLHHYRSLLVRNERREASLLTMSAKERFLHFVRTFPGDINRIKQYHIASYLGITSVALSREKRQWLSEL